MASINITFPDGSVKQYQSGITPLQIAESLSSQLARDVLAATVNDKGVGSRPPHRSRRYPASPQMGRPRRQARLLALVGPPSRRSSTGAISRREIRHRPRHRKRVLLRHRPGRQPAHIGRLCKIEKKCSNSPARSSQSSRADISKADALKLFGDRGEEYKCELISELEDGSITTYTQGSFTDLCRGPHIPNTSPIKAVKVTSLAGAFWRGDESASSSCASTASHSPSRRCSTSI